MDKPLKFFLGFSVGFFLFIIIVIVASSMKDPRKAGNQSKKENSDMLVKAERRAGETMDTLFKLYPEFSQNSFARFAIENNKGRVVQVWGAITELESDHVSVIILEKFDPDDLLPESVDLSIDQVEDWIVEVGGGRVRGGFSTQALLMKERNTNNTVSIDSQLQLFVDRIE